MRLFAKSARSRVTKRSSSANQARLQLEGLETRVVPYSVSGNAWPHGNLVTISFMPDGTNLGTTTSNLFSTFNGRFGSAATWQNVILKAAQQWAKATNLNFAVVSDDGSAAGSGSYQQGAPNFGDIRIGGYNFGSSTLAQAYMPPPVNNYSVAGDISFNTGQPFNINGQAYDLFTVAMHEFGHALGMNHSSLSNAVMYGIYTGVLNGLSTDDANGIESVYSNGSPRSADAFGSLNNSVAAAANINGYVDGPSGTALVPGMDITVAGEKDYYTVTAPATVSSTVTFGVQSQGLSLLAPKVYVYASDGVTQIGYASGAGRYGTTVTVNLANGVVTPNEVLYVKVLGADATALGTGAYALTASFAGNPLPAVPLPNTQTANGGPLSSGGGLALSTKDGFGPTDDDDPTPTSRNANGGTFTPQVVALVNAAATQTVMTAVMTTPRAEAILTPEAVPARSNAAADAAFAKALSNRLTPAAVEALAGQEIGGDALPAGSPTGREIAPETQATETAPEQVRRDVCFADDSWLLASNHAGTASELAGESDFGAALSPAARVAALAIVFGGTGARPARTERRVLVG